VILQCSYEELKALKDGAHALLDERATEPYSVAAPPEDHAPIEALVPRLTGTLSIRTLQDQRSIQRAVDAVVRYLRAEMEMLVTTTHPASEGAVVAYFDFAHAFSVQHRVREIGAEMAALIEVMTGEPATPEVAASFVFPD
jgi:hypothetical protein